MRKGVFLRGKSSSHLSVKSEKEGFNLLGNNRIRIELKDLELMGKGIRSASSGSGFRTRIGLLAEFFWKRNNFGREERENKE